MELVVPGRFCGPARSGNGGWTAGALASLVVAGVGTAVTVRLRQPPPLDAAMTVVQGDDSWTASFGGAVVAQAWTVIDGAGEHDLGPVEVDPVGVEEARAAESSYPGLTSHPFPTCFACGTGRAPGDGLRIFPGPVGVTEDGLDRVAATWRPDPSLTWHEDQTSMAVAWAALDCVGGWAGDLGERLMVLGEMKARVDALPVIGEEHVVVGQARGSEGRRTFTSSTLYDADGRVVGTAEHIWFAVDPAAFA